MHYVSIDLIDKNPWQPRRDFDPDSLRELAESIQIHHDTRRETRGLLQLPAGRLVTSGIAAPAHLVMIPDGDVIDNWLEENGLRVQLAYGHRRLEAFKLLQYLLLPVDLGFFSDEEMATMAWTENSSRRDLTAIEEARGIQQMIESFSWTQRDVAEKLKLNRATISNKLRLLKLPDEQQQMLQDGRMSERQAMAILGLFDIPQEILDKADSYFDDQTQPKAIIADALEGDSSDSIRERVMMLLRRYAIDLKDIPWLDLVLEGEGVRSRVCKECDARIKERNFCTDKECFTVKKSLWERSQLQAASAERGIPMLEPGKSRWDVTILSNFSDRDRMAKESGCENLRLIYNQSPNENDPDIPGHPHAEIVCSRRNGFCSCQKGAQMIIKNDPVVESESGADPQPDAFTVTMDQLQEAAREQRILRRKGGQFAKRIAADVANRFQEAIESRQPGAWRLLARNLHYSLAQDDMQGAAYDLVIQKIANYLADQALPFTPESPEYVLNHVNKDLQRAGCDPLAMPEDFEISEETEVTE